MKSSASELGLTVYFILVAMRNKNASYPKGNLANALYTTHNNIIFCRTLNLLVLFKLPHHAVLRQNFKFLKAHEAEGLLAICIFLIKVSGTDTVRDRHVSLLTCFLYTVLLTYLCNVQSNRCQKYSGKHTKMRAQNSSL